MKLSLLFRSRHFSVNLVKGPTTRLDFSPTQTVWTCLGLEKTSLRFDFDLRNLNLVVGKRLAWLA